MPKVIVNNPNIVFESSPGEAGFAGAALRSAAIDESDMAAVRLLRQFRQEIEELACSATWADDCLFRGPLRARFPLCLRQLQQIFPRPVASQAVPGIEILDRLPGRDGRGPGIRRGIRPAAQRPTALWQRFRPPPAHLNGKKPD